MKNKKLVTKMIGLILSASITTGALTGCGNSSEYTDFVNSISYDSNMSLGDFYSIMYNNNETSHYLIFRLWSKKPYTIYSFKLTDVVYSVSKEDYFNFIQNLKEDFFVNQVYVDENIKLCQTIVDKYDPVAVFERKDQNTAIDSIEQIENQIEIYQSQINQK